MKKSDNILDQDIRVIFKMIARNKVVRKVFLFMLIMTVSMGTGGIITAYDEMPGYYYRYADVNNMEKVLFDTEYPERFDLREYGLVSAVRKQGGYGVCWAMAAVGSMETQLLAKTGKEILLSPWHLAYFGSLLKGKSMENGGDNVMATSLLADGVGPVSEDKVPYDSGDIDKKLQNDNEYTVTDVYSLKPYIYGTFFDKDTVKKLLYEKNAVSIGMAFKDDYYNSAVASYYCPDSIENNHAVLIVGWDDNYSKENFNRAPENDGAWIVKNSRGNDWGDDGYFYISYDDVNLSTASCYIISEDNKSQKIYSQDNRSWITSISTDKAQKSCVGYMASVFLSEDDAKVTSVSFYTIEPGAEYEVYIYTNLEDKNNPVSGIKSELTAGKNDYFGYMTVELTEHVDIEKGEWFSVVVKIVNPSSPYTVPVEASGYYYEKGISITNYIDTMIKSDSYKDNSFISNNGIVWRKIKNTVYEHKKRNYDSFLELSYSDGEVASECTIGGVCIKAFAELC